MSTQHGTLDLGRWTELQLRHAAKAVFADDAHSSVSFKAAFTDGAGIKLLYPFDPSLHNWNEPVLLHLDPDSIFMKGITHVGGVDISYRIDSQNGEAIVALVILEYPSMKLTRSFLEPINVTAPYIPSYLSIRELDHVLSIYDKATKLLSPEDMPEVIFVDGFGRWHERQAGLATALGVERGIRTIGVGKEYHPLGHKFDRVSPREELLDSERPGPRLEEHWRLKQKSFREMTRKLLIQRGDLLAVPLHKDGPIVGAAVYAAPRHSTRFKPPPLPVYISSGNRMSLETAISLSVSCCVREHSRLPEPIIMADRLGRDEVKRRWG